MKLAIGDGQVAVKMKQEIKSYLEAQGIEETQTLTAGTAGLGYVSADQ